MFITRNSPDTVPVNFTISLFLDTNILVYLVDDLYESLNEFISYANNNIYANLFSSQFVIFEFVGVRKKEHYLREVLLKNAVVDALGNLNINKLNLSSLLKYKDSYETPDVKFEDVQADIESKVENDLAKLESVLNIDSISHSMHSMLLETTKGLFLISKISKEDCLVVASAVWPNTSRSSTNLVFLSNDKEFVSRLKDVSTKTYFVGRGATAPEPALLKAVGSKSHDLTLFIKKVSITANAKAMFLSVIRKSNDALYLGKTVAAPARVPNIVCFELDKHKSIPENSYLVIVDKDLNFFYSSAHVINKFKNFNDDIEYGFSCLESIKVCFELDPAIDADLSASYNKLHGIDYLRKAGHFVFLHPDSIV